MTTQQICDRLAEEDGWKKTMVSDDLGPPFPVWAKDGREHPSHTFRPYSLDDAVRGIPKGTPCRIESDKFAWSCELLPGNARDFCCGFGAYIAPAAVYGAIARMKGWAK